jgi:WD40 repeat protein
MSKNLIDKKSFSHQDAATEFLTPRLGSGSDACLADSDPCFELAPADPTERLPLADEAHDSDVTLQVRLPAASSPHGLSALPRVEGYEILEELGRGGMGVVYKAWQRSLQRSVALKMILAGSFAGVQELDRFRAEAMAIARLHHPNLLSIYEIGACAHLPFYAMEYMEGGSLSRRLNGAPVPPRSAAGLVRSLAQAMDYAHKNGIVHRDLKPPNILLTGNNNVPLEDCIAKVTDFGIAKHLHQDASYTRTGDILGTPNYMAPEQAMGRPAQIGPVADVYSLGAILYELLTGRPPFHGATGADVLLLLARQDPERPSHWVRSLPRDLETICLKCLEKDPARRYTTAGALADDLTRFLQSEPILAKPASLLDRTIKWTRRRPALAAILAMAGCIAALAFGMMALMLRQAVEHADEQERMRVKAVHQLDVQDQLVTASKALLADAYLDRGIHLAERDDVRRGMHWMLRALEIAQEVERRENKPSVLEPIIRMNLSAWGQCVSGREKLLPHQRWAWDVAFVPGQPFVATASKDTYVQIWHAQTAQRVGPALAHPFPVWGLAFHPDGKTLFTICGDVEFGHAGWLSVWTADPNNPGHYQPRGAPMMFPYELYRIKINAPGDRLFVSSQRDGLACLLAFDPAGPGNGVSLVGAPLDGHPHAAFSPDGALLASILGGADPYGRSNAQTDECVQLWNARTGEPIGCPLLHSGPVRSVAFSNDGRFLIAGSTNDFDLTKGETSRIHVWDAATCSRVADSFALPGRIKTLAVAGSNELFAVSLFEYAIGKKPDDPIRVTDGKIMLWQLHADGKIEPHGDPLRPQHVVWSMEFSPDSRMLLAGCENSGAYLWSVSNGQQLQPTIWHDGNSVKVAFSKDGRQALTASAGGAFNASARLWDVPRFSHIGLPLPQRAGIRAAYWDEDGKSVWIGTGYHQERWDPDRGVRLDDIQLPRYAYHLCNPRDNQRFLFNFGTNQLHEMRRATGITTSLEPLADQKRPGVNYSYHAGKDVFLKFWQVPCRFQLFDGAGKPITKEITEPGFTLDNFVYSAEANCLAMSQSVLTRSNRVVLYDARDLSVKHVIPLAHAVRAITFSRAGKILVFGGADRQILRIDVETGKPVGTPLLQEQVVTWAAFLNNDRLLATCSEKGQVLLWDLQTGKRIGPSFEHHANLIAIEIDPAGKRLLTGTHGRMAMTWRFPKALEGSLEQLRHWVETMTGMEMTDADAIVPLDANTLLEQRERLAKGALPGM